MSPEITDFFGKASIDTDYAIATTVEATRTAGVTVLEAIDLSKFADETPVFFVTYKKTTDPVTDEVSVVDLVSWKGLVNTGANTITNLTLAPGYTDLGNDVGDFVECIPTSYWVNSFIDGIFVGFNPDGTLKGDAPIDNNQGSLDLITPVGSILDFAGTAAPTGWLLCYGQALNAVSDTEYADLFAVIGNSFGGTNNTDFVVPDLRGRVVAGQDDMGGSSANRLTGASGGVNGDTFAAAGGAETATNTLSDESYAQLSMFDSGGNSFMDGRVLSPVTSFSSNARVTSAGVTAGVASTKGVPLRGTTDAGNNVQPTLILNKIIKY